MRKVTVNIPIVIDTNYQIKDNIDSKWIIGDVIYSGDNDIHNVRIDNDDGKDCKEVRHVAKIMKINNDDKHDNYNPSNKVRNELVITKMMSDEGIGPTVHDMSINENEAIIIMDKFDCTLHDLMLSYISDRTIPIPKILDDLQNLITKMHTLNIYHGDLHLGNILCGSSKSGKIVISDYGRSVHTSSQELKHVELNDFGGFRQLHRLIDEGSIGINDEDCFIDILLDFCAPSPYFFNFTIDGERCKWY
jgi:tRNA A-37 threonylcarbamoyl transferase component Bud32